MKWKAISTLGLAIVSAGCALDPVGPTATPDRELAGPAFSLGGDLTWAVQSDYFGERNAIAQSRTIRSMALSHDGSSVYTGLIQSPNVGTNALRKVSSAVLAIPGTDHVIFGNGMPGGTGGFGPVGGQPVYAGGATGTFQGWTAIGNSPRGLATDDRGYVYAALSSGVSPANQVRIYSGDLSAQAGAFSVTGPTGVAIGKDGSTYYAYVASGTLLRRWDVTNPAAPVMDAAWTPPVFSGVDGLTVDADGTVYLAGGGVVRRISPDGSSITHTSAAITGVADVAAYGNKLYAIARTNPITPHVFVLNKADLTSGGPDIAVPDLIPERPRGFLAQFTAIDIGPDGKIYVSEENYTAGSSGVSSYTPPATTFNLTPGAITGRIYFDRVLVSSALSEPLPPTPNQMKQAVMDALQGMLPTGDDKLDKRIEKAIAALSKSLTLEWWIDGETLDPKDGKQVFDLEKKVVKELSNKQFADNPDAQALIQIILDADRALAVKAIADAEAAGGIQKGIDEAYKELAKGDEERAKGKYEAAVEGYKKAWENAQKATQKT